MALNPAKIARTVAHAESLPAPVGGWNARDALANMAPTDAVTLTNLYPGVSSCDLRGGYLSQATGMNGDVQSLLVYQAPTLNQMFAVDSVGLKVYNVSNPGAVGASVFSGLTNAIWDHANISTPGGHFMYACNGTDAPLLYDGTTWTAITNVSTPAITGVNPSLFINCLLFKNRMWFIEKNSLRAWYLPTQSIGGAAQMLDMGAIATNGGYLVDMCAWTIDAGFGVDDQLCFITNKGEVIVWHGTDPASAGTWAEVGVWQLGAPMGRRSLIKYAGDCLLLCVDGLWPLAGALQSSRTQPQVALSDKIKNAIQKATIAYGGNFGWQVFIYPKQNAAWINVPAGAGQQQQYVINTITDNWCNFTGWPATCWALFNDEPYFGSSGGKVWKAWDTCYNDNGQNIQSFAIQAFNFFEMRGVEKYFTRARPNLISNGQPTVLMGGALDFDLTVQPEPITFAPTPYGVWDVSRWDQALWGQSLTIYNNWQGLAGIGYCLGTVFQSASMGIQISWASTDIVFQAGWAGI